MTNMRNWDFCQGCINILGFIGMVTEKEGLDISLLLDDMSSFGFHNHLLQVHRCLLQCYRPDFTSIISIYSRMIAHTTYSYYRLCGFAGNHELAVLIRHAAIYQ